MTPATLESAPAESPVGGTAPPTAEHGALMDRIYGLQRHIYDATRKFFLFGRDGLLAKMRLPESAQVAEIGCGTARNLIILSRRPGVKLFGLDASSEMLVTARAKVARRGLSGRIQLAHGFAEKMTPATFGLERPFDALVYSYALSMIPPWKESVDAGLKALAPKGEMHIVDFWDMAAWPRWFQALLQWWLSLFHVKHEPALLEYLKGLEKSGWRVEIESVGGRYAYRAVIRRA